eukprot:m.23479 g.23479  ORF g.23479 m.23479 type:complete len:392 (-) comp14223_c0_seq1:100-1275(-)
MSMTNGCSFMSVVVVMTVFMMSVHVEAQKPLGFSWDTLPVHWFSANATAQLSEVAAMNIAGRHSLAILNGQAHAYYASPIGAGAERKMLEASRLLKQASKNLGRPPIAVLAYFNSVLDWTAYDFHTWLSDDPTRFLTGNNGLRIVGRRDNLNNMLYIPDFSQAAVSERWIQTLVNTTIDMDGVFVDQAKWCSPFACKPPSILSPIKLAAWTEGHWQMLLNLRKALPLKLIVINNLNTTDFPLGFDHEYEKFDANASRIQQLEADATDGRVATCHVEGHYETTLPTFLLGAGEYAYFAAPFQRGQVAVPGDDGWVEPAWDGWRPDYSRKLGQPLGLATVTNGITTRHFASGTSVVMDTRSGENGCVFWADGNTTGTPASCEHLRTIVSERIV